MADSSKFYPILNFDDDSNMKPIDPSPPPRQHKKSSDAGGAKHFDELILRHKHLFEALLSVEGIDDDATSLTSSNEFVAGDNRKLSQTRSSAAVANWLQKEDSNLCGSTASDANDYAPDTASVSSENEVAVETDEKITWRQRLLANLMANYAELMDALSETNEDRAKVAEITRPLNAIELRHNVKRCLVQSKPYLDTAAGIYDIFVWHNPLSTLFMFWVYMYCVYKGYIVTLFLGLMLMQLMINYLNYCRRISLGLNLLPHKETKLIKLDFSGAQLIIEVSRKVQILLDFFADYMEKIKNLFTWKLPKTTWRFVFLVAYWFILSMILPTSWFLTVVGFGIGGKLFLTTYLFHRFPRLRHKFDVIVWFMDRLPTDGALRKNINDPLYAKQNSPAGKITYNKNSEKVNMNSSPNGGGSQMKKVVRKCVLLDNEKSFPFNVGSGALHIANTHLLFKYHRFNAGTRELLCVPFDEILSVNKTKALKLTNFGEGMSIEVYVAGRQKPYVFSGMLKRDECFEAICSFGYQYGAAWARL